MSNYFNVRLLSCKKWRYRNETFEHVRDCLISRGMYFFPPPPPHLTNKEKTLLQPPLLGAWSWKVEDRSKALSKYLSFLSKKKKKKTCYWGTSACAYGLICLEVLIGAWTCYREQGLDKPGGRINSRLLQIAFTNYALQIALSFDLKVG